MSLKGETTAEKIWNYLIGKGLNEFGVAGLMGNLYAESAFVSNNLQGTYNTKLGMTDAQYTEAVDNGTYTNFVHDSAGYGLAQWTYWSRKQALLNFAKSRKTSIGDLEMQLEFLVKELTESYGSVLNVLKNASSVLQASNEVLLKYERPADQSVAVQNKRAAYGQQYYDSYAGKKAPATTQFVPRLTRPEAGNKYYITKDAGGYSNAIKGNPTDKDCNVLSNCVGYAYGRFNEIGGYGSCKYLTSTNAENFMQYKGSLESGMTPRLGACMVWQKGATLNGSDGAGHVAIVEKIISDTEVVTSESGWGNPTPFWTKTRKKGDGNWGSGSEYKFLGFIYNPAVKDGVPQSSGSGTVASDLSKLKVGDIVDFTGSTHYASANAATGPACKPGKAKVTALYQTGKRPVHLIAVNGGGSNVYGWVNLSDIKV